MRLWCPGAVVVTAPNGRISTHDGGSMLGGPPRCTQHTYEAGYSLTAVRAAQGLIAAGNEVHLTFNPVYGGVAQILPADRAGRGLVNLPGGVQTNRQGTVNVQIEVIARADRPWTLDLTDAGRASLDKIMSWLRYDLGIPDVWPAGPPPAYSNGANHPENSRSAAVWVSKPGYYGHSQVPENDHGDPGALDIRVLAAAGRRTAPTTPSPTAASVPPACLLEGEMYFRATTDSTSKGADGKPLAPARSVFHCATDPRLGGTRYWLPGSASPLAQAVERAGGLIDVDGQDIIDAYPTLVPVPQV